jgi:predicted anti-sigma-YlaC factor YlaD
MRCHEARLLFTVLWDDEITQAEKEGIEGHFASCPSCRREYDEYARALELVAALPRVETSADMVEATLARARRSSTAPDHVTERPAWVPATAAAALLIVVAALVTHWTGVGPGPWVDRPVASLPATPPATTTPVATAPAPASATKAPASGPVATAADSLFDPNQDVEFVLDPVTLRRGRASVMQTLPAGVQAERAVISF